MEEKERTKEKKYQKVSVSDSGFKTLEKYRDLVNKTSKRKIKSPEILDFLIEKLSETDIPKIHERYYSATDRLAILLENLNSKSPGKTISEDELLASLLDSFKKTGLVKGHKAGLIK